MLRSILMEPPYSPIPPETLAASAGSDIHGVQSNAPSSLFCLVSRLLTKKYKPLMALMFSAVFQLLAILLSGLAIYQFVLAIPDPGSDMISAVVKSTNSFVIALAMFELGAGVSKEYSSSDEGENVYFNVRRTITRFVGTVCIALVLEALIMIIKYSQLELAGNLFYPVGILIGGSILLMALGMFLWLTRGHTE